MADNAPTAPQTTHLISEPPGRDIAILLNLAVVDQLQRLMREAGDVEIGGVLLGRREGDGANGTRRIIVIDDFELVESEHLRGTVYAVSQRDMKALESTLTRARLEGAATPAGFFRSHLRKGLYLDEADFSLFREYFSGESNVFLVARREPEGIPVAGFFFWENGMLERRATYEQFPLDRQSLESGGHSLLHGTLQRTASPGALLRPMERPADTHPDIVEPAAVAPAPAERLPTMPPPQDRRTRRILYGTIGGALIAGTLIWAAFLRFGTQGEESSTVSLTVARRANALRVSWDPSAPAVQHANNGILWITDGEKRHGLELNSDRLKAGNYDYTPQSPVVNFRLDLLKVLAEGSESVRYVADRGAEPGPAPATKPAPENPKRSEPITVARQVAPEPAAPETEPPKPAPPKPRTQPVVSITTQPIPPSRVRAFMAKVPLIRSLQRNRYHGGDAFVPPRTTREVMPQVPVNLAKELPPQTRVDMKVSLDADGRVREIDLLSRGADDRLVSLAAEALRQWRFEPARVRDRAVPCELLATLNFRNPGGMLMAQRQ